MTHRIDERVTKAVALIWTSFDPEAMQQGYDLLTEAAEAGDPDACCFLARCHLGEAYVWSGGGFETDEEEAAELLRESIERGSAMGVLCALRTGDLTPDERERMPFASLKEAFDAVVAQAEAGDPFSRYVAGNAWFWGDLLEIEGPAWSDRFRTEEAYDRYAYPIAARYYEQSFESGLANGFGNYRTIFESGLAPIDEQTFEGWMKRLAAAGNPLVTNDYGILLETRYDDAAGAFACYRKAFELGDTESAYNVGVCYGRGYGVAQDLDKAFEYYLAAAEAGHPKAQFAVGNFYFEGRGKIAQDPARALPWLEQACYNENAEDDFAPAVELALCYRNGWGCPRNDRRAFALLEEIEERIDEVWEPLDAQICHALGTAYAFGRGTEEDIPRGIAWLDRAIELGSEEAARDRAQFRKRLIGGWKRR